MSIAEIAPGTAVEVRLPEHTLSKFERERCAFFKLLPQLLATHKGQFVAIHDEAVAATGANRLQVAMQVLNHVGNVDIYVGLVSEAPEAPARSGLRRALAGEGSA